MPINQKFIKLINLYRYLKIQIRLLLTFVLISLIPILIVSYTTYSISISTIDKKISIYSNEIINQIEKNFSKELIMIESTAKELTFNEDIVNGLENYKNIDIAKKREFIKEFNSFLTLKKGINSYIDGITAYIDEETQFGDNIQLKIPNKTIEDLYKQAEEKDRKSVWSIIKDSQGSSLLVIGRPFKSNYTTKNLGLLVIFVKNKYLYNSIKDVNIGEGANIIITNSEEIALADKSLPNVFGKEYKNKELMEKVKENENNNINVFPTTLDNKPQLISFSKVKNTNWFIIVSIPYDYLNKEIKIVRNVILLVVIIFSALAVVSSYFIAYSISKPLKSFVNVIKKAADGDLTVEIEDNTKDEIAIVLMNFNIMIKNIRDIIVEGSKITNNIISSSKNISNTIKESNKNLINILDTNTRISNGATSQADDISESVSQLNYLSEQINKTVKSVNTLSDVIMKLRKNIKNKDNNDLYWKENLDKDIFSHMENIFNNMKDTELLINKVLESKGIVLNTMNSVSIISEESAIISDYVLKTTNTQVVESERLLNLSYELMKMAENLVSSISNLKVSNNNK